MAEIRLGSLNYVALMGRVTQEPELKYTPKGTPVCNFNIAVNRRWKDNTTNEWKEETSFFRVTTLGRAAERCGEVLKKGSAVLIEGRLRSRSWNTPNGEKRNIIEIVTFRVQILDKLAPEAEITPEPEIDEGVDIPKDQLDDIPF
jgi:single-strand DNA-binding protein|uniref:Single-stranded DNA-binding protein n=1 Tax=candidate division WOR-3 bacterium TaxID=2052148 RepID=A0A7C6A839_UNCW3